MISLPTTSRSMISRDVLSLCGDAAGNREVNELQRRLKAGIARGELIDAKALHQYQHTFTHGADGKVNLYTRMFRKPPKTLSISQIHQTEHPYILASGILLILDVDARKWVRFEGPYIGITKPGTRRISYSKSKVVLITSHVTDTDDLEEIERQVIYPHDVPLDFEIPPLPK